MQTATASRNLKIDGMSGDVCIQKVKDALGAVSGVTTSSVKVGSAAISCDQSQCEAASAAVAKAGYKNMLSAPDNTATPERSSHSAPGQSNIANGAANASTDRPVSGTPSQTNAAPAMQRAPQDHKSASGTHSA
jgi:copper chaperone CopZ